MIKNNWKFILFLSVFSLAILAPRVVCAATVYLSSERDVINVGDTAIINIRLDTQNAAVNVVEGDVAVKNGAQNIEVRDLSVAGSDLSFWSRRPSWETDQTKFIFAGGVPGGFNKPNGLLFKVALLAKKPGQITLDPSKFAVYANDGKGTLLPVIEKPFVLQIVERTSSSTPPIDELNKIISADTVPPEFLAANVGHDPSLFDGKLFLFINASDFQSGLDFFEVKEGDLPVVQSGSTYVLQDQTQNSKIVITAHDKAGNIRNLAINPSPASKNITLRNIIGLIILILVIAVGLAVVVIKKRRRK